MSLSDIYVQLNQLGFQVEFLGDVNNKYATLKVNGYYIENRIVDSGFRITGNDVFLSVFDSQDVIRFFKQKL
ncbi:hypothetical protein HOT02_gp026 [Staphylococcus phage phiSA_BS2]|uniref:Uncharacterized protein n=1 Tax=Staphylococcus phage phiSA_BS2 TaxID=2126724 RepID=A0A2R3ZXI2_9CAUD|nr:hypothetical protein HOT02_gp026 [Staphylococcus phage phiSA_BS2]AVR55471.1 hypothetical protein phiSABS2_26 [Staphylococcus phage phiSA_BS2]WFG34109.1 hypothetical protein F10086_187 [Staphylococcus phage vB_SauM_JDF86]